ncbi:type II toxin-antitoxin system HicB family antitoxin [Pedobacter hiemivivus]|uniref:Type II toxin-antitoxin system HicB family antitoxin n=1 Tax=Pedobacter hiemivivus TaxID=2530454 RepID=A0A4U1GLF6_9SPHI|nr:type II toxin-antitoxin system HicB family antitoxin [Pedobacter hiemivivus]TCC98355.1 type II toxin-antitoxin system HicB family antitoxin [Pedobacter hiemivivus]TKC65078.1 type II toxin-antitoxin system HicB family antitoxin [Pedobacter hiemivivus]
MKNYFEYEGYIGSVEFSAEDRVFFGKIHGINDLVTFEGASVNELESAFKDAIIDYLKTCKELGKKPNKTYKGSFNVRVSEKLHQDSALLAKKKGVNLNELVKASLSYMVQHEELLDKETLYA